MLCEICQHVLNVYMESELTGNKVFSAKIKATVKYLDTSNVSSGSSKFNKILKTPESLIRAHICKSRA